MAPRLPPTRYLNELSSLYEAPPSDGSVFLWAKQQPGQQAGVLVRASAGNGKKKRKLSALVLPKDLPRFISELSTLQRARLTALARSNLSSKAKEKEKYKASSKAASTQSR